MENYHCLQDHVDDDHKERIGEVVEKPDFNRFDDWSAGETVGHWEVDWGQHHHAGDVDGKDDLISIFHCYKICSLVDDID